MNKIISINPSTYETLGEVEVSTEEEIKKVVSQAKATQPDWASLSVAERCEILKSFLAISKKNAEKIAYKIAEETGRPINNTLPGNVYGGIEYFEAYLKMAEGYLAPQVTYETAQEIHEVIKEPWGVVACICPWNYPYMNVIWQCVPALLAGNAIIYKNSEENPLFAQYIAELLEQTDIPKGVFNIIYGDGKTGEQLVKQDINLISFTGSAQVGKQLAKVAAEKFIPIIAELGGSSPGVIFEDAIVDDELIEDIFNKRFKHSGQICGAIKRLIVHEKHFDQAIEKLKSMSLEQKIGNALDQDTNLGPLVAERQVARIEEQVEDAIKKGAKVICGGKRPKELKGAYYEPTILTDITPDMKVWNEETFGPVLAVVSFKDEDEAIKLANDTKYGLGAHIYTENKDLFIRVAKQIDSGMVAQNNIDYFHPNSPFGGYKESGMGRMHGQFGFDEVTQVKLIAKEK